MQQKYNVFFRYQKEHKKNISRDPDILIIVTRKYIPMSFKV